MTRLLLDTMLGRLATYLRMCGYDTAYAREDAPDSDEGTPLESDDGTPLESDDGTPLESDDGTPLDSDDGTVLDSDDGTVLESDDAILEYARETGRTIFTRDRELARRYGESLLLESREITDQLQEVADAGYTLTLPETPTRCGVCNGTLTGVAPDVQTPAYAPDPATVECWRCEDCGQFFWKGSHWDDVAETLATIE